METPTLNQINKIVFNFLNSKTPEVLVIRGKWGVGKTFAWNYLLNEAKRYTELEWNKEKRLENYSYVSLFGINDLKELKRTIFENTIPSISIGQENGEPNLETLGEMSGKLFKKYSSHLKLPEYFEKFNPFDTHSFNDSLPNFAINNQLICLDDIERKGKKLEVRDILGLVNHLKEEKECKIVLLLNDDEKGVKEIDKYREKVFDYEILFEPSCEESLEIAFNKYSFSEDVNGILKSSIRRLEIKNVRVIIKILRRFKPLAELLKNRHATIKLHSIEAFVLAMNSQLRSSNETIPPLSFLKETDFVIFNMSRNASSFLSDIPENKHQLDEWFDYVQKYGVECISPRTSPIFYYVNTGILENIIELKFNNWEHIIDTYNQNESFSATWDMIYNSFEFNEDDVVKELLQRAKNNIQIIESHRLNDACKFLEQINRKNEAKVLAEFYAKEVTDRDKLINDHQHILDVREPQGISSIFLNEFPFPNKGLEKELNLVEILYKFVNKSQPTIDQLNKLVLLSDDEFNNVINQISPRDLKIIWRESFKYYEDTKNAKGTILTTFCDRLKNTVKKMGRGEKIDEHRISYILGEQYE
ncbi:hypothetical protein EP331_14555 [bacterium]|nr:MAG: hypothetical protein EP331_14555 [bacterium]